MNEKLKEAANKFDDNWCWPKANHEQPLPSTYSILAAAARGEIPDFQLVPVELSEKNKRAVFLALAHADDEQRLWNDLLAASKEEFK